MRTIELRIVAVGCHTADSDRIVVIIIIARPGSAVNSDDTVLL